MANDDEQLTEAELGELAAFSDGTLARGERPRVFDRMQNSPSIQGLVDEQQVAIVAVAMLDAPAPAGLLARLEAAPFQTTEAVPSPAKRRPSPAKRRPRLRLAGGFATALAVGAFAMVSVTGIDEPSIGDTAELAGRGASAPAPAVDPEDPGLLAASVAGVAFPNYPRSLGWRRSGERADELDGRQTRTVFYRRDDDAIAYSIVSGEPLAWPAGARTVNRGGLELRLLEHEGLAVVTWLRDGQTCVISSADAGGDELLDLASWGAEPITPA